MDPRRRFTRAATCAAFCFVIAAAALSCRANPVSSHRKKGNAVLEITVGGVVPPAASRARSRASTVSEAVVSPAILPNTATIRVVVEDEDGEKTTRTASYPGTSEISVADLPAEETLSVEVAALDSGGAVVTSWSGTVELAAGSNALTASLAPPSAAVNALAAATVSAGAVTLASSVALSSGGVAFYSIPLNSAAGGEYQVLYDTGKARWAWLGAYDSSWAPLTVVCSDQSQGWVVVSVPAGGATVNIALSNSVASPGYPAGDLTGALQARIATFVTPTGTGSGTSADPANEPRMVSEVTEDGQSIFGRADDTFVTDNAFTLTGDVRIYGGFSADWKSRTGRTTMSSTASTGPTTVIVSSGTGCLDGLTITGLDLGSAATSRGLSISASGNYVVSNSVITGNTNTSTITGQGSYGSYGVVINAGSPEIANSRISGGTVNNADYSSSTFGIQLGASNPYIHNCDIDGGTSIAQDVESSAEAYGMYITGAASPAIAGCRIWGGTVSSGDSGQSWSYGIYDVSTTTGSVLVNSVISGGVSNGYFYGIYGVYIAAPAGIVAGCTIDSGNSAGTSASGVYAFRIANANTGKYAANAIFSSTPSEGTALSDYSTSNAALIIGDGLFSCAQEVSAGGTAYTMVQMSSSVNPAYYVGNVADTGRTPAAEFRSYASAPATFADFLAVDWRGASSATIAGLASGGSPQSVGVAQALFDTYPALGFDLAGNVRTYSGTWSRGAYQ